jgi:hypothetical protein
LNAGSGHNNGLVKFSLETLLHDLEMQKPQVAAAKTLTECRRGIFLIYERCIIKLIFFQGFQQRLVIIRCYRVDR